MRVYFDNAATTPVREEAIELMTRMMRDDFGNPSSNHLLGRNAKKALDEARESVASALGARKDEIFFTSGGTEADNWAVFGACRLNHRNGRHIITTETEHDAVKNPVAEMEKNGCEVTYLSPEKDGTVSLEAFKEALRPDTALVSVMAVNNETGAVNPVHLFAEEIRRRGLKAIFHTDAVQAFCKIPLPAKAFGADIVSISGHKIHAPKGVGALYIRSGVKLPPLILGGGQEQGRRSGTEGIPSICGFGEAARLGLKELRETHEHVSRLRSLAENELKREIPDIVFISEGGSPYILSLSLPGHKSEVLMNFLEREGIFVAKSAACKKGGRSRVLEAMKLKNEVIDGAIRVSFSKRNTAAEVRFFAEKLGEASKKIMRA